MDESGNNLQPLADYLEPQFGDVYDGFDPPDIQPWTPELNIAVKRYLIHEVSDEDYAAFLKELEFPVSDASREAQADAIVEAAQPWEVAHAFHTAVVKAVPTLDQLIGHLKSWRHEDEALDADDWLDAHATEAQLAELAELTDHPERKLAIPRDQPVPRAWHFVYELKPPALLDVWHQVIGGGASLMAITADNSSAGKAQAAVSPSSGEVPPQPEPATPHQIRAWARAQGYEVGDRGRLPKSLREEYEHSRKAA